MLLCVKCFDIWYSLDYNFFVNATIVQFNMRVFTRPRISPLNCCNAQHFFITSGRLEEIELFSFRFTRGQYLWFQCFSTRVWRFSQRGEVIGGLNIDAFVGRKIRKWQWNSSKPFFLYQRRNEQSQRLERNNSSTISAKTIMGWNNADRSLRQKWLPRAIYYRFLLYRHECFTGKYSTRNIHKNYLPDPSGLFSIISHVSLSIT